MQARPTPQHAAASLQEPNRRSSSMTVKWLLGGAVSAALLAATFRGVDPTRAADLIEGLGVSAPLLLLPSLAAVTLECHAWQLGLLLSGYRTRLLPLSGVRIASESFGSVLPLGVVWADAAKPPLLASRCGVPLPAGFAAIAVRKYLLMMSQAGYMMIAFIFGERALGDAFMHAAGLPALRFIAPAAACALALIASTTAVLLGRGSAFRRVLDWLSNARWCIAPLRARLSRLERGAVGTDDAAAAFFGSPIARRLRALGVNLAAWLLEATETWLMLRALGAGLGWGDAAGIETLVALSRHLLPFLPGGLGVQELGYTALLSGVGCNVDQALSLVLLKRLREAVWVAAGAVSLAGAGALRAPASSPSLGGLPAQPAPNAG